MDYIFLPIPYKGMIGVTLKKTNNLRLRHFLYRKQTNKQTNILAKPAPKKECLKDKELWFSQPATLYVLLICKRNNFTISSISVIFSSNN